MAEDDDDDLNDGEEAQGLGDEDPNADPNAESAEAEEDGEGEDSAELEDKPEVTHVTPAQWWSVGGLAFVLLFLYYVWPVFVSEKRLLKDEEVYINNAREAFTAAHKQNSFPRSERLDSLKECAWNYKTSEIAGAELKTPDLFRWAYSAFEVAKEKFSDGSLGYIKPIRLLTRSYESMSEREKREGVVAPEKIEYLLGIAYLKLGNAQKAVGYFERLKKKKWDQENYFRNLKNTDGKVPEPFSFAATPYRLNLTDLYRVDMLLGEAYYSMGDPVKASTSLKDYLESTRYSNLQNRITGQDMVMDLEARFRSLKLLGRIYWERARSEYNRLKEKLAAHNPDAEINQIRRLWKTNLEQSEQYLMEAMGQDYQVYNLAEPKLLLAEINYRLGMLAKALKEPGWQNRHRARMNKTIELAKNYTNDDRSRHQEMLLWEMLATFELNPDAPLAPVLVGISGDNIDPAVRLGALVTLGRVQIERGVGDRTLGKLLDQTYMPTYGRAWGVFLRAAENYPEELFTQSPFIDKMTVVDFVTQRAQKARQQGDEQGAIELYSFLLKYFSVPQAETLHQIAYLKRLQAHKLKPEEGLSDKVRDLYHQSGEFFLMAQDRPYDRRALRNMYFEAGESFFAGKYFTRAYEAYNTFTSIQPKDDRVSKANYKKAYSALYKKNENRYREAESALFENIRVRLRPVEDNRVTPVDYLIHNTTDFRLFLDKTQTAARDLWAYKSFLMLGDVYYLEHDYDMAERVYRKILSDPRFAPESEVWRGAAYQLGKLMFDKTYESKRIEKPWSEVITRLEELLIRFDVKLLPQKDIVLINEVRRDNAEIKYRLVRSYLESDNPLRAEQHARELLNQKEDFDPTPSQQQRTLAMLGDALYRQQKYQDAYEYYRRAHDWFSDSVEAPVYSLMMADCLEGMNRIGEARALLQRTRWEFENFYEVDPRIAALSPNQQMDKDFWLNLVDGRLRRL